MTTVKKGKLSSLLIHCKLLKPVPHLARCKLRADITKKRGAQQMGDVFTQTK